MGETEALYRAAERRIERLTLGLGAAGALAALFFWNWRAGAGVAAGAALAWINFRWLKQGVGALAQAFSVQAGEESARIPKNVHVKFLGRFALLLAAIYVMVRYSLLPAVAVLAGLFTLVAAVLAEMVYLLLRGQGQPDAG